MARNPGTAKRVPRKISPDWSAWGEKLAACLASLKEDQFLIISTKRGNHYIQFAGQGDFGMRMETSSNEYLAKSEKLSASQISALLAAGWHKPTAKPPRKSTAAKPVKGPIGSPNFFRDVSAPVQARDVAEFTVLTFAVILGIPHPGFLHYRAFENEVGPLDLPQLGLKRAKEVSSSKQEWNLRELLLETMREATGLTGLEYDKDGDIQVGHGNTALFVSIGERMSYVRIHALLLDGVKEQPGLYERLNEFNAHSTMLRFTYRNEVLSAIADIDVEHYFSKKQVTHVFHFCVRVADDMSASLQAEFGGNTSYTKPEVALVRH
jgi:hypothetical protein